MTGLPVGSSMGYGLRHVGLLDHPHVGDWLVALIAARDHTFHALPAGTTGPTSRTT